MSEHAWFEEHLAAYSSGGLTPSERERFEHHAASCADCARSLNDWAGFDHSLDDLFAEVRPETGLEDRLLQGLRTVPSRRRRWPVMVRAAAAVAALVMLGVLGAVMQNLIENGKLPFPGLWAEGPKRTQAGNELKQIRVGVESYTQLTHGTTHHGMNFSPDGRQVALGDGSVRNLETAGKSIDLLEEAKVAETGAIGESTLKQLGNYNLFWPSGDLDPNSQNQYFVGVQEKNNSEFERYKEYKERNLERYRQLAKTGVIDQRVLDETNQDRKVAFGFSVEKPILGIAPGGGGRPVNLPSGGEAAYFKPADAPPAKVVVKNEIAKPKYTVTSGKVFKVPAEVTEVALGQGKEPSAPPGRKIVRSGDVEYEVDSFDAAVERVKKLVDLIKGGYVATVNSDKLANGKVKGSVVVRLPPESLDKFLADLRKDLGKTGDLKSMRIGSQDITKQYTDVESRLRAAKTMEERLLQIIKSGKGEIKDLVVAEEKLGIVRTKIEEMEGEIRYYNNQVSLSKLTIGLTEKEIRAASALEVTEKIKMRLEVEEVEKAQETVLDEVKKAKGRVIKSDLKLHGAGQLEAIMIFEVAPKQVPDLRKVLKSLGNITKDEAERQQTAVGGSEPAGDIKPQVKDTNFEVRLYNLANIQPRETLTLTVATLDVPGSYKKLQEAVKAKGQVRKGQFIEQNKLNISAVLEFDLNVKDRPAIDKVLAEVGKEIGRSTDQAQPSENVTDQKIGYKLTLLSVASIAPREKIVLEIEVKNVEQTAADLVEQAKSHKGLVADGPLFQIEPDGQVSARILFSVPLSAKDELAKNIKGAGIVHLQRTSPNPKVPDNELATATILVVLTSRGPIVSSEDALGPQIRKSLFYSFKIFSISLSFVLLGILGILPPALVLFGAYKLVRKWQKKSSAA